MKEYLKSLTINRDSEEVPIDELDELGYENIFKTIALAETMKDNLSSHQDALDMALIASDPYEFYGEDFDYENVEKEKKELMSDISKLEDDIETLKNTLGEDEDALEEKLENYKAMEDLENTISEFEMYHGIDVEDLDLLSDTSILS